MRKGLGHLLFAAAFVMVIAGLMLVLVQKFTAEPVVLDSPENEAIKQALYQGYDTLSYATQTGDPSTLSEIFVDSPEYQLPEDVIESIAADFGPEVAEKAGYLTAMEIKTIVYTNVQKDYQAAKEKAKAENRDITAEEYRAIIKKNKGVIPPSNELIDKEKYKPRGSSRSLVFEKIEVSGDKAFIYYDDGAAYQKAILVKIDGKWMIAGIVPINIHF